MCVCYTFACQDSEATHPTACLQCASRRRSQAEAVAKFINIRADACESNAMYVCIDAYIFKYVVMCGVCVGVCKYTLTLVFTEFL